MQGKNRTIYGYCVLEGIGGEKSPLFLFSKLGIDFCVNVYYYICVNKSEVVKMSPRTGRPTSNPKTEEIKIRATKQDKELLKECCEVLSQTQYDVVMNGIKKVHAEIKK